MRTRACIAIRRSSIATCCATISSALLLLCAAAGTSSAQGVPSGGQGSVQSQGQARVRIVSRVVSMQTGQPLAFARVDIDALDRHTLTDANGTFRLERVPAGDHILRAELLGYQAHAWKVVANEDAAMEMRLREDALMLQGLTVTADRFRDRLRSFAYPFRVLDRAAIAGSGASDVRNLIATRAGLVTVSCGKSISFCVRVRGAVVRPTVYVDDALRPAGVEELTLMSPSEITRVEVLRGGVQIRVYTEQFTEWAARNDYRPRPFAPI